MEIFYKRKAPNSGTSARNSCRLDDINWEEEIKYPGLRKDIDAYHPNQREREREREGNIWRIDHANLARAIFPLHRLGKKDNPRRFQPEWFDEFGSWLEYSESKDRAYCFCCFLFREKKDA